MEYKVKIGVSNHHVHLTKETYEKLFDEPLEKDRDLSQIGEFASNRFVTLVNENNQIDHVRVVGPLRSYNQVEISKSEAVSLKINPPIRRSGDLKDASSITIVGPKGSVTVNACVIAQRHIHMNFKDLEKYGVKDNQEVNVRIDNTERKGTLIANIKASDNGVLEMHIDRDEANAFLLSNQDEVTFIV